MVQRRAARFVTSDYRRTTSVTSILESLNWDTLRERRAKSKLLNLHKILFNELLIDNFDELRMSISNRIFGIASNVDSHRFSFFPSTTRLWNNLDTEVRNMSDYNQFRSHIMTNRVYSAGFTNC